jgi:hypothetical protein
MAAEDKREFRGRDRWLSFALILGPAAWLAHLTISYALVPETCAGGSNLKLHVATAICFAVAMAAAAIGWWIRGVVVDGGVLRKERTRWMATSVVVLSISMAVIIVAQEIPNVIMGACD